MFVRYIEDPRPAEVYSVGSGQENAILLRESFNLIDEVTENALNYTLSEQRKSDHQWWFSDLSKFRSHCPR